MSSVQELGAAIEGLGTKASLAADAMERAFARGAAAATAAAREMSAAADSMGQAMGGIGGVRGSSETFNPAAYESSAIPLATGAYAYTQLGQSDRVRFGPGPGTGFTMPGYSRNRPSPFGGYLAGPGGSGGGGADEPFDPRPSLHYPGQRQPLSGARGGGSHLGALIEGVALYEAMKAGAEEEQSIDITLLRGFNIDPRKATAEQKGDLRALAARSAEGTSFSEREVAAGMPVLAAPLGFTGPEGMRSFMEIFEVAAKAAEAAKQLKFGTFEGSLAGAVEFAHQMRAYKPEELQPAMNRLGAITETLPHGDMEREALVMGYVIPQARALGADPMEAMTAVGFLQQSGLRNTVAATTLRQMLVGQLKSGGPLGAHIESEKTELENALGLKSGHLRSGGKGNEHDKALLDLGITDAGGNLKDLNAKGGIDIDKMFALLGSAQERMTPVEFGKALYGAFGVRGETGGAIIAEALPQYRAYQQRVAGTAPLDEQLKMVQGNSVQLTGQAVARVADLGNEIGTTLLPILRQFDEAIIMATGYLRGLVGEHPTATAVVTAGGIGASIMAGVMTMRALPHWIGKLFAEGSAEQVRGVLGGAGPRAGLGLTGALGLLGDLALPTIVSGDVPGLGDMGRETARQKGGAEWVAWQKAHPNPASWLWQQVMGGAGPRAGTDAAPLRQAQPSPNVTVTIGSITVPAETQAWYNAIVTKLKDAIKTGIEHASSSPAGTDMSPYLYGGF